MEIEKSSRRVIYNGFEGMKAIATDHLYKQYGWESVAHFGRTFSNNAHRQVAPSGLFFDSMALRQGLFDYSSLGTPIPIDQDTITQVSRYELNFLGLLEDSSGWNYSFRQRRDYYFAILKFWNTVLHRLKPNLLVAFTIPHTPECLPLYALCKLKFSIDVLFIDPIPYFGGDNYLIGSTISEIHAPFIQSYDRGDTLVPSDELRAYLNTVRGKNGIPPATIVRGEEIHRNRSITSKVLRLGNALGSTVLRIGRQRPNMAWKKNRQPISNSNSRMSPLGYYLFVVNLRRKTRSLARYYKKLCVKPDLSKPFIYFAAPYQPEAVTAINGEAYEDLFLALDILSFVIPKEWTILYKEHPFIFADPLGKGVTRRSSEFYSRLQEYENVLLVSVEENTFELIDNSEAVSTVCGTVGFEAAVRGKPVLGFGNCWYLACQSIYWIQSLTDAQDAIARVISGERPDQDDLERYLAAIEKKCFSAIPHDLFSYLIDSYPDKESRLIELAEEINRTSLGLGLTLSSRSERCG
jgi:hypothetical protein